MRLASMRYKDYVWPHNPRVYTIEYSGLWGAKGAFGRYHLQDLGPAQRVMRGEGEFVGEGAYGEFKKLATVFYAGGPGLLVHPVWQTSNAYFVELSLRQEPRAEEGVYWSRSSWAGSSWPMSYSLSASTPLMPWAAPEPGDLGRAAVVDDPLGTGIDDRSGPPDWPMMQAPFNCSMVKNLPWCGWV